MRRTRHLALLALLVLLTLPACLPGSIGFLRDVDGQTWAARFDVAVGPTGGPAVRFPVDLTLTFRQTGADVTADGLLVLTGRLGFDGHLDLESRSGLLTFEGRFVRNRLIGTVAIAGVAPVGNVEFTRVR